MSQYIKETAADYLFLLFVVDSSNGGLGVAFNNKQDWKEMQEKSWVPNLT
jgi:hypothetical protein